PPPAAAPVTRNVRRERPFRASSLLWPSIRFSIAQLFVSSRSRCLFDGGANAWICAATTDIVRHVRVDLGIRRLGIAIDKSDRRHDRTRLAVHHLHDFDI